jgi:hypothetical protein
MCRPFHHLLIKTCKNIFRMFERVVHSKTSCRSVIAAGVAGMLLAYGPALADSTNQPPPPTYTILIRGYYTGDGTAQVSGGMVTMSSNNVRDQSGRTGTLVGNAIDLVGNKFSGPATILGGTVTVQGRVDAPDPTVGISPADVIVTDGRIQAVYVDSHGHTGRIVGTLVKTATQPGR